MKRPRPSYIALALLSSTLLTACPGSSPGGGGQIYIPPAGTAKIGLAVGTTNSLTCIDFLGRSFTGPATAITLALRDASGAVIQPNGGQAINLELTMPGGGRQFIFKNPYNPTIEDASTFPASENYFVLCTPPLAGNYTLSGSVAGQSVSDSAFLENATPPSLPGGGVNLQLRSASQAQVSWNPSSTDQVAVVNYYRGRERDFALEGYRVGFAAATPPAVVITPPPLRKPTTTTNPSSDSCANGTSVVQPKPPPGPISKLSLEPMSCKAPGTFPPQSLGSWGFAAQNAPDVPSLRRGGFSTSLSFSADSSVGSLKSQAVSGNLTVNLEKTSEYDYSHVEQQQYYAEVITSSVALGPETSPDSLRRNDLTVRYSAPTSSGNIGTPMQARFSLTPTNLSQRTGGDTPYLSYTTSLLALDGWPTVEDYDVNISGPGGTLSYTYPSFGAYALGMVPVTGNTAGIFNVNFVKKKGGSSFSRSTSVQGAPLPTPNATLSLDSNAQSFTLELPSSNPPLRHWLYVYRRPSATDNSSPLVASKTLIPSEANTSGGVVRYSIPADTGVSLSSSETYTYNLYSTEAPLELYPLLNGTGFSFSQPIRWAVQQRNAVKPLEVTLTASSTAVPLGGSVTFTMNTKTTDLASAKVFLFQYTSPTQGITVFSSDLPNPTGIRTYVAQFPQSGSFRYFAYISDEPQGKSYLAKSSDVVITVATANDLARLEVIPSKPKLVGADALTLSVKGFDSSTPPNPIDLTGKTPQYALFDFFPQNIVTLEPSGRVSTLGTNIGDFTVTGSVDGVTGKSATINVNGVACITGPSGNDTLVVCNFRNANGQAVPGYKIGVTAPNGQTFVRTQEFDNPITLFDFLPIPAQTGTYSFSVISDQTYSDTSSANATGPSVPVASNLKVLAGSTNSQVRLGWSNPSNTTTIAGVRPLCSNNGEGAGVCPSLLNSSKVVSPTSATFNFATPLAAGCYEWEVRTTNLTLVSSNISVLPTQIGSAVAPRAYFRVSGGAVSEGCNVQ